MQNDILFMDKGNRQPSLTQSEIADISKLIEKTIYETEAFITRFFEYFTTPPTVDFLLYVLEKGDCRSCEPIDVAKSMARILRNESILPSVISTIHGKKHSEKEDYKKGNMIIEKMDGYKEIEATIERSLLDARDYTKNFKKCPHGVPLTLLCGICDREEYKSYWGID